MVRSEQGKPKVIALGTSPMSEKLPYRIELWDENGAALERILARAVTASLARAIFKAAQTEYPARVIRLLRGKRVIAQSD